MTDADAATILAFGIVFGIVAAVGTFAFIPKPPWLDRIWLWMIGGSFVLVVPIWVGLMVQDHGWAPVALGLGALFFAGFVRGWSKRG